MANPEKHLKIQIKITKPLQNSMKSRNLNIYFHQGWVIQPIFFRFFVTSVPVEFCAIAKPITEDPHIKIIMA